MTQGQENKPAPAQDEREAVEVEAYLIRNKAVAAHRSVRLFVDPSCYDTNTETLPLMTVAQHERIVAALTRPAQTEQQPELTVWEGPMPESNGKSNFTAVLMRKGADLLEGISGGMTIARSEYPDRVRYEADCVRWLIGEMKEEPCITDYDADKHSGYAAPIAQTAPKIAAKMPCGTAVTNVYEAYEAGKRAAAPQPEQDESLNMEPEGDNAYLVVDPEDNYHICYVVRSKDQALQHATDGLLAFGPITQGGNS